MLSLLWACAGSGRDPSEQPDSAASGETADAAMRDAKVGPASQMRDSSRPLDARVTLDAEPSDARAKASLQLAHESPSCLAYKLPSVQHNGDFFEFCIDDRAEYLSAVLAVLEPIAGDFAYDLGLPGTIGCAPGSEWLVYGIQKSVSADLLCEVTRLSYVERIAWGYSPH